MNWVIVAVLALLLVLGVRDMFEHHEAYTKCIGAGYVYLHGQCLDVKQVKLP